MESICSAGIPAHGPRPAMRPGPDLVTAVVATSFETLADDAEECLQRERQGSPAMAELTGFLSRVMDTVAHNRAVKAAAYALSADHAAHPAMQEVETRSPRPSAGSSAPHKPRAVCAPTSPSTTCT